MDDDDSFNWKTEEDMPLPPPPPLPAEPPETAMSGFTKGCSVKGVNLKDKTIKALDAVSFRECTFYKIDFSDIHECYFSNCRFDQCVFFKLVSDNRFYDCKASACDFKHMKKSTIKNSSFDILMDNGTIDGIVSTKSMISISGSNSKIVNVSANESSTITISALDFRIEKFKTRNSVAHINTKNGYMCDISMSRCKIPSFVCNRTSIVNISIKNCNQKDSHHVFMVVNSNVVNADIVQCYLQKPSFSKSDFTSLNISKSNFSMANFNSCKISASNLTRSNFSKADFKDACMDNVKICECKMKGALLGETTMKNTHRIQQKSETIMLCCDAAQNDKAEILFYDRHGEVIEKKHVTKKDDSEDPIPLYSTSEVLNACHYMEITIHSSQWFGLSTRQTQKSSMRLFSDNYEYERRIDRNTTAKFFPQKRIHKENKNQRLKRSNSWHIISNVDLF